MKPHWQNQPNSQSICLKPRLNDTPGISIPISFFLMVVDVHSYGNKYFFLRNCKIYTCNLVKVA